MTQGSATGTNKRSWTDRPEETKNKLGALIFLGFSASVLLAILLWFLWPVPATKTFAATISITEYGDVLPSPKFGIWNIEKMRTTMQNNGLQAWTSIDKSAPSANLDNRRDIEARVAEWSDDLKKNNLDAKSTVIVQLRCHAAVIRKDNEKPWQCCLYVGESASESSRYPVSEFMELLLTKILAKNIILVADICDLKSSQQLGLILNPVATYIQKACEDLKLDTKYPDRKLWIICSADDYQTAYYSDLRQKTLIQEACEDALRMNVEKKELSLARYFESIYRHCNTATNGKQTPRLFLANTHDDCLANNSNGWKLAEKVLVGRVSGKAPKIEVKEKFEGKKDSGKDEIKPANQPRKTAASSMRKLIRPVSMIQRDETGIKGGLPEPSSSKPAVTDIDPAFRLWQLRDQIAMRGDSRDNWSPADFAPFVWRQLQYDALRELSSKNKNKERLESDCEALIRLQNAISSTKSVESINGKSLGWDLCRAWNDFLTSDTGYRLHWQEATNGLGDSNHLTDLERRKWRVTRSEYRSYIDSISNLTFWNDFIAEYPEYPELQSEYGKLMDCLKTARTVIPKESFESAAEKSLDMQLEKARKAREAMAKFLANRVSELVTMTNTQLSWLEEREYEVLLASPLLSYEQRKELRSSFANKEEKKVTAKDLPIFDSMYTAARIGLSSDSKDELSRYCQRLRDIAVLCSNAELPAMPVSPEDFLVWSEKHVKTMRNAADRSLEINDITQRWHYLSLKETRLDSTPVGTERSFEPQLNWGIVVPPINPKAIRLVLSAGSQFDFLDGQKITTLPIGIRHFDNTDVVECNIQWSAPPALKDVSLAVSGKRIERDRPTSIKPQSKKIELQCNVPVTALQDISQISIKALDSSQNSNSEQLNIPLVRNSGRIELIARRVDDQSKLAIKNGNEIKFSSPAIKGAASRFSFALLNKLPTPRRAEVKVYALPSFELPSTKELSAKNLFADSGIVTLSGSSETKILLKSFEQNKTTKFFENVSATDSSLVFQVLEYELDETDKATAGAKPKNAPALYHGHFSPTRPNLDNFITIKPREIRENIELGIEFESNQRLWDSYGLKALPITIHSKSALDSKPWSPPEIQRLLLQADKRVGFFKGPGMDSKKHFRFSVDIGGFPRAAVLDAKPNMSAMDLVDEDHVSIKEIRPLVKERTDVKLLVDKNGDRFIFPNRIGIIQVFYDGIEIDAVLDKGVNSIAVMDISKRETPGKPEIPPMEIEFDRWYQTLLSTEPDGHLSLAFEAAEMRFRPKIETGDLEGVYVLGIRTGGQQATKEIVFDKSPLEKSSVECSGRPTGRRIELFKGEKVELSIRARDGESGSGIKSAIFAISNTETPFSDSDTPLNKPDDLSLLTVEGDKVKFILDSASAVLEKKPAGDVWVVARTLDGAGNQQDNNKPLKISWTNKANPSAPK